MLPSLLLSPLNFVFLLKFKFTFVAQLKAGFVEEWRVGWWENKILLNKFINLGFPALIRALD